MFLSRLMSSTKFRYWFTKFEIVNLIWIFRKIQHFIEFVKLSTIVYTNHEASLIVVKQISFTTSFTNKWNLRSITTSNYIIKHESKRLHLMFNVLSRLSIKVSFKINQKNIFDLLFTTFMTKISDDFKKSLS